MYGVKKLIRRYNDSGFLYTTLWGVKMKFKVRNIIKILIITLLVSYFSFNLAQSTFAINQNKSPNVIVTINSNGSISQEGNLFDGQLYPATEEQAEKGIGSISGVIRISNQFKKINVENMAIGLKNLAIKNNYSENEVFESFLRNIRLKIEKGVLFSFNKTIIDYTRLENILYKQDSDKYKGYVLETKDKFSIARGETIDLRYTLQMVPEAGNELEAITAYMPIYINLMENIVDDGGGDDDDDNGNGDKVEVIDEPVPEAQLNKNDHIQYIQGYPDNTVRPEGLITREEVSAVFYRLLETEYKWRMLTLVEGFKDVESNRWSVKHIATLANGSIINGYPDGSFRPSRYITRAELATIASKFDKLSPSESNLFSDISGHWASKYINSAALKGWINGYPDGTFKPDQYITRAEFVTLVNNVLERRVHKEHILPDANKFPDLSETMWYYEAMMEAINSHICIRLEDTYEQWTEIYYPNLDM